MVVCGIAMGMFYDTYRTLERMCYLTRWLVRVCDFLFWLSCTFLVFGTLLRVNEGMVRIYIFLGLGLGMVVYFLALQSMYLVILKKLISFCLFSYRVILRILYYLIVAPLRFLYRFLFSIVVFLLTALLAIGGWFYRPVRWLGRRMWERTGKLVKTPVKKVKRIFLNTGKVLTRWVKGKKM